MGEYDEIICNTYQLYGIRCILLYLEQSVPLSVCIKFSNFDMLIIHLLKCLLFVKCNYKVSERCISNFHY